MYYCRYSLHVLRAPDSTLVRCHHSASPRHPFFRITQVSFLFLCFPFFSHPLLHRWWSHCPCKLTSALVLLPEARVVIPPKPVLDFCLCADFEQGHWDNKNWLLKLSCALNGQSQDTVLCILAIEATVYFIS